MFSDRILTEKQRNKKKFLGTLEGVVKTKVCKSSIFTATWKFSSLQKDKKIRAETAPRNSK